MFTGIIETTGILKDIISSGTNKTFWVLSPVSSELTIEQSVSHNGVCLTVEEIKDGTHKVTAIEETLLKTDLNNWKVESVINMERCLQMNGRLDGHIVQGHIDTAATCMNTIAKNGSWEYTFEFDKKFATLIIEKGSIAINGISLTIFSAKENSFTVAMIPYTYQHTNMQYLKTGDQANIEFDMIGKYVTRFMELK